MATRKYGKPDDAMLARMRQLARNFGQLSAVLTMWESIGEEAVNLLEQQQISGADIWLLFKDECGQDVDLIIQALREGTAVEKLRQNVNSSFYQQA